MNTLQELAESAKKYSGPNLEDKSFDLKAAYDRLLPCETQAKEELAKRMQDVKTAQGTTSLDRKYPRIDLNEALKSSKRQKGVPFPVPRFAAFNVDRGTCTISSKKWKIGNSPETTVPEGLDIAYASFADEVRDRAESHLILLETFVRIAWLAAVALALTWTISHFISGTHAWYHVATTIVAGIGGLIWLAVLGALTDGNSLFENSICSLKLQMGGALPTPVREKINTLRKEFDQVYIVAEAGKWTYSTKAEFNPSFMSDPDPLVIGKKNGAFYLVDKFDLTSAENWLASEFAGSTPKPD